MSTKTKEKPKPKAGAGVFLPRVAEVFTPPGAEAFLSARQVVELLQCSPRYFRGIVAAGEYPAPDAAVGRNPRWKLSTHNEFVRNFKRKDT